MKYIKMIGIFFMSLFFISCAGDNQNIREVSSLKVKEGFIAIRFLSNKDVKQFLYFNNAEATATQNFFSSSRRFIMDNDPALKLYAVPTGKYTWSGLYLSGGAGTSLINLPSFNVIAGKINYVGDIETTVFIRRSSALIKAKNKSEQAKKELIKTNPMLLKQYPFVTDISKFH